MLTELNYIYGFFFNVLHECAPRHANICVRFFRFPQWSDLHNLFNVSVCVASPWSSRSGDCSFLLKESRTRNIPVKIEKSHSPYYK